jgi:hypothetical protein
MLSIAADFARVLWSPAAVFQRRRLTRVWRVLFVLWVITSLLAIAVVLSVAATDPEFLIKRADPDRTREVSILQIVAVLAVAIPILWLVFLPPVAAIQAAGVWLGARALGLQLPMNRAVVIAALSSLVTIVFFVPLGVGFFLSGRPLDEALSQTPVWMEVLGLSLGPLAPESRPILGVLLSAVGIPAFWLAALHAIGAREMTGSARPVKFTAPVFWAASTAVALILTVVLTPIGKLVEESSQAAERRAVEPADTTRAPARAP